MIYVTFERKIRRPPPVVWGFLTDVGALVTWVDALVEARVLDDQPLGVGAQLVLVRRSPGNIEHVLAEVTAFREPSLIAMETRIEKWLFLDRVTLTAVPEGTLLGIFVERMYGPRSPSLFARQPGLSVPSPQEWAIRQAYQRSVEALVERIERESLVPFR